MPINMYRKTLVICEHNKKIVIITYWHYLFRDSLINIRTVGVDLKLV